ncbi:MAG: DUF6465 family protein [Lachnospiraceae bacterium]|nr:DUF6465 family protein [Lachnospiraceae bacterium]
MAENKKVDVKKVAEEAKKATETVKATAEKTAETVKASAEKTAKKATATAKKATTTAKKATAKKTTKKVVATKSAVLQFAGEDFKVEDVIARAEQAFKAENKRKAIQDIKVYLKPEERAAYYVVTSGESEYAGRIDL